MVGVNVFSLDEMRSLAMPEYSRTMDIEALMLKMLSDFHLYLFRVSFVKLNCCLLFNSMNYLKF